jgi:hypothetical protein
MYVTRTRRQPHSNPKLPCSRNRSSDLSPIARSMAQTDEKTEPLRPLRKSARTLPFDCQATRTLRLKKQSGHSELFAAIHVQTQQLSLAKRKTRFRRWSITALSRSLADEFQTAQTPGERRPTIGKATLLINLQAGSSQVPSVHATRIFRPSLA